MSIKKEFSKYANEYKNYNIIQEIVAKSLIRELKFKPKRILELGCGSGQIFKNINWDIDFYKAVDFSKTMCELHPKDKKLLVKCLDFDSKEFFADIKDEKYDIIISSSSLQWSKNLDKLLKNLALLSKNINMALFTSNTFKSLHSILNINSPILSEDYIKSSFSKYFFCEFETILYKLEFKNKKEIFSYIKKSGISGGVKSLDFKSAKKLYLDYSLDYLEFEVIFIKTLSKS